MPLSAPIAEISWNSGAPGLPEKFPSTAPSATVATGTSSILSISNHPQRLRCEPHQRPHRPARRRELLDERLAAYLLLRPSVWLLLREVLMSERGFTIPEIALIAGTRVALGAGLGLLIAGKLSSDTRKGAGWALLAVGALSTIPLVVDVVSKSQLAEKRTA